jgi:uncharacterized protein
MTSVVFGGPYVRRIIDDQLDEVFPHLPAILLDGPKGVGKTATAERRCATVRRLDDPQVAQIVRAEPSIVGADPQPVLIDEWHRIHDVWDAVRRQVDADPHGEQFLLTGSAPVRGTHSGAGRIVSVRMRPLSLTERLLEPPSVSLAALLSGDRPDIAGTTELGLGDYVDEILASGFPGMRRLSGRALAAALDSYVERIVDHDLPEAGFTVRRPATVLAWLRAYAAATATSTSWERIRDAATPGDGTKPAKTTTIHYTELLSQLRIFDPIEAWSPSLNHFGRLAAAPKHHLADPALAARLLRRTRAHLLSGESGGVVVPNDGTLLGNLFESLTALTVRTAAQAAGASVSHLRTRNGDHEVDFIIEGDAGVVAVEAKLASAVDDGDVRHLAWLREKLGDRLHDAVIVTTGREAHRRPDGIAVVPLSLLGH